MTIRQNSNPIIKVWGTIVVLALVLISPTILTPTALAAGACTNRSATFGCPPQPPPFYFEGNQCGVEPYLFCSYDDDDFNGKCGGDQVFDCETCKCVCDTEKFPCSGCTAEWSVLGQACGPPENGRYVDGCGTCASNVEGQGGGMQYYRSDDLDDSTMLTMNVFQVAEAYDISDFDYIQALESRIGISVSSFDVISELVRRGGKKLSVIRDIAAEVRGAGRLELAVHHLPCAKDCPTSSGIFGWTQEGEQGEKGSPVNGFWLIAFLIASAFIVGHFVPHKFTDRFLKKRKGRLFGRRR